MQTSTTKIIQFILLATSVVGTRGVIRAQAVAALGFSSYTAGTCAALAAPAISPPVDVQKSFGRTKGGVDALADIAATQGNHFGNMKRRRSATVNDAMMAAGMTLAAPAGAVAATMDASVTFNAPEELAAPVGVVVRTRAAPAGFATPASMGQMTLDAPLDVDPRITAPARVRRVFTVVPYPALTGTLPGGPAFVAPGRFPPGFNTPPCLLAARTAEAPAAIAAPITSGSSYTTLPGLITSGSFVPVAPPVARACRSVTTDLIPPDQYVAF